MQKVAKNVNDVKRIAELFLQKTTKELSKNFDSSFVVLLSGELGAGKTTFTQNVGKILGINNKINSPTFVIMKRYKLKHKNFENLFHIDAYRLKSEKDLIVLGWEEIISNPKNIIFIEWPQNIKKAIPKKHIKINIAHIKKGGRKYVFK